MSEIKLFHHNQAFELESGASLPELTLAYITFGTLREDRSNVVWVCHALTGNADARDWWKGLFDSKAVFDPSQYFIICVNALGSCYGSTGPLSINSKTGKKYFHDFPEITNRDIVGAFELLRRNLQIDEISCLIGGSLGGQQVLEWAILQPHVFQNIFPIASNAWHSSWGIAFNEAQRMAIEADSTWSENDDLAGHNGLKAARATAMLSYRTYNIFKKNQPVKSDQQLSDFPAAGYQQYMGEKISRRFNAYSYHRLSKAMDSHHVGRGRSSVSEALSRIKANTLVIGIDQDILFPLEEQRFLVSQIKNAKYAELKTIYGHDGFLVEFDQLNQLLKDFLDQ